MLTQQTLENLHAMGLRGMASAYRAQLSDPEAPGLSFDERMGLLVDREWSGRQDRGLREAHLRLSAACIEDIDYRTAWGLQRSMGCTLAEGRWRNDGQSVLITGPTGVGKTFLACALANTACRLGKHARYYRTSQLVGELGLARADGSRPRLLSRLARMDLLVVDDWGLAVLTPVEARDLPDLVDDRCQRRATLIASQLPLDRWHSVMPDPTVA